MRTGTTATPAIPDACFVTYRLPLRKCIHLIETFDHRNHVCIVTELLGMCVYDFLKENDFHPFPRSHIQQFARQLLSSVACTSHLVDRQIDQSAHCPMQFYMTSASSIPISNRKISYLSIMPIPSLKSKYPVHLERYVLRAYRVLAVLTDSTATCDTAAANITRLRYPADRLWECDL